MRPKSRMMDVHQVFQEFADGTSMHGVPRIINARSVTARIFWSVICLGAFGMFFWQCGILLQRYYSYPKKVNVEILQQPVPFPAVSVCNVDHLDFEMADMLTTILKEEFRYEEAASGGGSPMEMGGNETGTMDMDMEMPDFMDGSDYDYEALMKQFSEGAAGPAVDTYANHTRFVRHYMKFVNNALLFMPAYAEFYKRSTAFTLEALSRLGLPANLGTDITSEGGVRLRDFIINCRFMDDKCNTSTSFKRIFDPYYFNCFTFNPEDILPSRSMRLRGVDYGLSVLLHTGSAGLIRESTIWGDPETQNQTAVYLPGVQESDSALAGGRGSRVVVHSPDTRPFPTAEGYDIPPGFSVTIGVKARENVRIAGNHGNCTRNATDHSTGEDFKYTLMSCQNECIQQQIMSQCSCVDNRLSIPIETNGLPFCFQIPENLESVCMMNPFNITTPYSSDCRKVLDVWRKTMICRRQVYDDMTIHKPEAMEKCRCYPPCNDIVYDSSYSLSTLPDDPKDNTALFIKIGEYIGQITDEKRKDLLATKFGSHQNIKPGSVRFLSRLNVHIADNNIMKTTESPDYEAIRLVSDIGGQLGLWIGISVMTLFEVLQLIADVFRYLTAKGRHVGEKKMNPPNTISGPKRTYGNGDRFRVPEFDIELPCEIDKLTTV